MTSFCMSEGSINVEAHSLLFSTRTSGDNQRQSHETTMHSGVAERQIPAGPSVKYLRLEFPSECWDFPSVATSVTHSIQRFFLNSLPKDARIERVYWFSEDDVLKVWTVIPEPDFSLERPIYEAQILFMEKFHEYECDFSVIYRFGKSINDIEPQGAYVVL